VFGRMVVRLAAPQSLVPIGKRPAPLVMWRLGRGGVLLRSRDPRDMKGVVAT